MVLSILDKDSLYANESKFDFGLTKLLYLRHIISVDGVRVDLKKVRAIIDWPTTMNLTQLKGFFGLCGFCWRFFKGFS